MPWHRSLCLVMLGVVLVNCGEAPPESTGADGPDSMVVDNVAPVWSGDRTWTVSPAPSLVIGASTGERPDGPLDPTSISVDPSGRILIGDGDQAGWHAVLVYDSEGEFLFAAGGEGQGPGEFGQLWWSSAYRGDSILAFDVAGDELTVFAPDGQFARQARLPQLPSERPAPGTYGFSNGAHGAFANGSFLAYPQSSPNVSSGTGIEWQSHPFLLLSPDASTWDTLGTFRLWQQSWDGSRQENIYLGPFQQVLVGPEHFYFSDSSTPEVHVYDQAGRRVRVIRWPSVPRPVTEADKTVLRDWMMGMMAGSSEMNQEMLDQFEQTMVDAPYPSTLPALSKLLLDPDGNLWVEAYRWFDDPSPIKGPSTWSVFDSAGIWLGDVEAPPGLAVKAVTRDRVFGFVFDEFDVPTVVGHDLIKP